MKSRTKLLADLQALEGFPGLVLPAKPADLDFMNEVYGKQAMIYFEWPGVKSRIRGELALEKLGHKIHKNYSPGSPRSEIQVSYFKGKEKS